MPDTPHRKGKGAASTPRGATPQPLAEVARRPLPRDIDAEQALLAACILEGGRESVDACLQAALTPDHFFEPRHQLIYESLVELSKSGAAVDEVVLADKLRAAGRVEDIGGPAYIQQIVNRIETPGLIAEYLRIVRDTALLRKVISVSAHTIETAYQGCDNVKSFVDAVEADILAIQGMGVGDSLHDMTGMMDAAGKQIQFLIKHGGAITGVPTGFSDLDKMTTGFHANQMIVVAARPGMGKTSMALNMAEAAILPKGDRPAVPTLMFSLEMGAEELAMRLLCSRAGVNSEKLRAGHFKEYEHALAKTATELKKAPLFVDDSASLNILQIRAKARRVKRKLGDGRERPTLGMVIIDYLQLIAPVNSNLPRHEQIGEISRGCKAMAKELGVPVLALCQLNRETEREKRQPRMSDLRESGSIEQDADIVLLIAKKKEGDDQDDESPLAAPRDLIIAKQRSGPTGKVDMVFNKSTTRFSGAAPSHY